MPVKLRLQKTFEHLEASFELSRRQCSPFVVEHCNTSTTAPLRKFEKLQTGPKVLRVKDEFIAPVSLRTLLPFWLCWFVVLVFCFWVVCFGVAAGFVSLSFTKLR